MGNGEIILYAAEDGSTVIQLRAEGGTVWLTRTEIADLFQTTPQNITLYVQGIYEEGEVDLESTSKDYLLVQSEGGRSVQREVKLYNLKLKSKNSIRLLLCILITQKIKPRIAKQ